MVELHPLHARHPRRFEQNRYVYPVLSRRSGGISLGVNLNPDKVCNFDCVYCQVDRVSPGEGKFVDTPRLLAELDELLTVAVSGELFAGPPFDATPLALRRLNDIAFSGDGEPTSYTNFDELMEACAAAKRRRGLDAVKLVLITNASLLHRPHVRRGLEILDANQGEIWAKLETGTEEYYRRIERTSVPFRRVLDNIAEAARTRPLVIQSLFLRLEGEPPSAAELDAYCDRLNEITAGGGTISRVQVYTVARRPAEASVTSLADAEVDAIAALVRRRTGLVAEVFYGGASA